jgi:hypothetical protein
MSFRLFSSDATVRQMYSLVALEIRKFNFFEWSGNNGEIHFEIDGLVAYFFSSF